MVRWSGDRQVNLNLLLTLVDVKLVTAWTHVLLKGYPLSTTTGTLKLHMATCQVSKNVSGTTGLRGGSTPRP